jgi:MFS transporter, DHA1 family, inner membrane transport protein
MPTRILLLLAFANFVIGIGAFVVIGVLTPIAGAFDVSHAEAGWVMTAYGLIYAASSPPLVALTGAVDRGFLIVGGLMTLLCGSLLAALAPSFATLLVARALMAVGAGLVTPVAASIAATLVEPERRGRALATVFGGFTLAQVFGVPAGAWLGYSFGWRTAFWAVALLSAIAAAILFKLIPRKLKVPATSLKSLGKVLATPRLDLAISLTALFFGALYALYTYLAAFLEARHGLGRDGVTMALTIFGVAAVIGNGLGGLLTDRIGPALTLVILCVAECVIMPFLTLVAMPLWATLATLAVWSVFSFAFMAAQQARLVALDPLRTSTLFSLNASALYLGGSIGALLGGEALKLAGVDALGPVGALLALAGLGSMALVARRSYQEGIFA